MPDAMRRVAETEKPVKGTRFNHLEIANHLGMAYATLIQEKASKDGTPAKKKQ